MIFVDTNVLIRFLMPPMTSKDAFMEERAHALLQQVQTGEVQATLSETVLGELCWLLSSPKHFGLGVPTVADMIRSLLNWTGWAFPVGDFAAYLAALDIWERDPKLEFSDSLVAARASAQGATLATFDVLLARAYSGAVWE